MNSSAKTGWLSIKWLGVQTRIKRLQRRIFRASSNGKKFQVVFLQHQLIKSLDAKLLAVRRVTSENKGRLTPGLDRKVYEKPIDKWELVKRLKIDGKATPIRRVMVPKPGKPEKRPLGIPTVLDRAKQKLMLMALEPQWEAKFEPNSYGFRPGRSCHDAVEAIFKNLRGRKHGAAKYILDADLKGCFDNIDQDYLVNKVTSVPLYRLQIKAWLKAGIFEGLSLSSDLYNTIPDNPFGTPQGGIISPFLANVALHGMENHLKQWILTQTWPAIRKQALSTDSKKRSISLIRYADDFIVMHKHLHVLLGAKQEIANWLASTSKLVFNDSKTSTKISYEGFNFLGFTFITIRRRGIERFKCYPSKNSQSRLIRNVSDLCKRLRSSSTYNLIKALRPRILGWANYFRVSECSHVFRKLTNTIFQIIRSWVFRRDKRHGRRKVKEKYFPSGKSYTFEGKVHKDEWILVGKCKLKSGVVDTIFLPHISWVSSKKHVKVAGIASVYDGNSVYWSTRSQKYGAFSTRINNLLRSQKGICPICKGKFDVDSVMEVDHITPRSKGGLDIYKNLQLLHKHCHAFKTRSDLGRYLEFDGEFTPN